MSPQRSKELLENWASWPASSGSWGCSWPAHHQKEWGRWMKSALEGALRITFPWAEVGKLGESEESPRQEGVGSLDEAGNTLGRRLSPSSRSFPTAPAHTSSVEPTSTYLPSSGTPYLCLHSQILGWTLREVGLEEDRHHPADHWSLHLGEDGWGDHFRKIPAQRDLRPRDSFTEQTLVLYQRGHILNWVGACSSVTTRSKLMVFRTLSNFWFGSLFSPALMLYPQTDRFQAAQFY